MDREKHQDNKMAEDKDLDQQETTMPGIIAALGELQPSAIITEEGIAHLFNRHVTSVKRAVGRGELPPPCRLFGSNAWTVGVVITHIETRLASEIDKVNKARSKIAQLSP